MFSTRGHWLPGDPRGFRARDHRIHSSGDYKHPPPRGEHAGLHQYARSILTRSVLLTSGQQRIVADALAEKVTSCGHAVRILSVDRVHVHMLFRAGNEDAEKIAGRAKQFASHRLRDELLGRIWGQHSHVVRVRDEGHYRRVVVYIAKHQSQQANVWEHPRFHDPSVKTAVLQT